MKKQRIFVSFLIFICLSAQIYSQKANSGSSNSEELKVILKKCAEYCEKLGSSVLDFVCDEKITEEIYHYTPGLGETEHEAMTGHEKIEIRGQATEIEKNVYVYDYQLIRKENKVQERRILLKENGKKRNEENAPLKTKRFHHKHVLFGPIGLLSEFWQEYYDYKIVKKHKFKGNRVIIIEAIPIPHLKTDNLYGKIWVKENDFSILKIEWNQKSIQGYDLIEEVARMFDANPLIKFHSEYAFEKNGIRFPSKYSITETYTRRTGGGNFTRSKNTVVYKEYKFFTVETEVKYQKSP